MDEPENVVNQEEATGEAASTEVVEQVADVDDGGETAADAVVENAADAAVAEADNASNAAGE